MKALNQSQNTFEKNSFILFVMMMFTNVCNYLFQIITGRLLTVEEYALENTLLSLLTICCIPGSVLSLIAVNYAAKASLGTGDFGMPEVIRLLGRFISVVTAFLFIAALLGAGRISAFFGIEDARYLVFLFFLAAASLLHQSVYSIQQGMQKFARMGIQNLLLTLGKLVIGCMLILAGWNVYGVLTGILLGTAAAVLYGMKPVRRHVKEAFLQSGRPDLRDMGIGEYTAGAVVIQCCMVVFTNGDMLLMKYYFSDTQAGIYSSAMVIGKIAMYVSSAAAAALFPAVVEMEARGEDSRKVLAKAFYYGGGACLACQTGMLVFGREVIGLLFGQKYLESIRYLPAVCFFVAPLTFVTMLMNYFLARSLVRIFAVTMLLGLAACMILTAFYHETMEGVMGICGGVLWCLFLFHLVFILSDRPKRKEGSAYDEKNINHHSCAGDQ